MGPASSGRQELRPMFGLRPWLAFFRRTEAFFLEVRFDMVAEATGPGRSDSRRASGATQAGDRDAVPASDRVQAGALSSVQTWSSQRADSPMAKGKTSQPVRSVKSVDTSE